jgi:hypothetical protein
MGETLAAVGLSLILASVVAVGFFLIIRYLLKHAV